LLLVHGHLKGKVRSSEPYHIEGTVQGIIVLDFAHQSGAGQYNAYQGDKDKDQATYISTNAVQACCLKASAKAPAPKNFMSMMDALKAAYMVWTVLFDRACPLVISWNVL
jgi:hypothetical protein